MNLNIKRINFPSLFVFMTVIVSDIAKFCAGLTEKSPVSMPTISTLKSCLIRTTARTTLRGDPLEPELEPKSNASHTKPKNDRF